ncbi:Smr/MutS family protein [Hymenobacter sp. H14-R3]|uniref:Smr/MutS family protein n=1 Tax=Hymenobacter sp. H14-R3 TaxID=3046308 RepID=UPI0024B8D2F4|nr:Smr/MutS family protein [Hymenobacter sp. H14-R3]MDJ0365501.1 Smr/MutS family protein [Hymenobacter sp. H14-R3]
MNVGDRVRLLMGTEEGIITRVLDSELVEVAIDNDFTIPVLLRELVPVAAEEGQAFRRPAPEITRPTTGSKKNKPTGGQPKALRLGSGVAMPPAAAPARAQPAGPSAGMPAARPASATPPPPAAKGLFLALVHQAPELLALHLLNNTEAEVVFTYGEERQGKYRALTADKLKAKAASAALAHLHLKDFEQWPAVVFQLLSFKLNADTAYDLLTKRQSFKASTFYTSRRPAPVIGKEAYLFQLDERPAPALNPEKLAQAEASLEAAFEAAANPAPKLDTKQASVLQQALAGDKPLAVPAAIAPAPPKPAAALVAPPHEFDLHLEALRPEGAEGLSNTAMLRLQLDAFEDALSRALATNMHEIIFIHGAGNGVLRKEIHRQLSRNKDIKFFEEAQKEKFGYGATLVRLK